MEVKCSKCKHEFVYKGKSAFFATCPKCYRKNKIFIKENLKYATILNCAHCGRDFYKKRDESKYCSALCQRRSAAVLARASQKGRDISGKNNPNWKGGISKNHYHYKKIQVKRYPEKVRCRQLFMRAKINGKIKVPFQCQMCNKQAKLHGHHDDYSKPLDVVWLCRACHINKHQDSH